jgi:hypothetical protein
MFGIIIITIIFINSPAIFQYNIKGIIILISRFAVLVPVGHRAHQKREARRGAFPGVAQRHHQYKNGRDAGRKQPPWFDARYDENNTYIPPICVAFWQMPLPTCSKDKRGGLA